MMKFKTLPAFIVAILSILPNLAFALGLGELKFDSGLGQRLSAQIEILGADDQIVQGMDVSLANDAVYERMGIERNPMVEQAKFDIVEGDEGNYFIQITTPNSVTEPFVNFLIEVNWRAGRLLREYTILLDPPVTLDEEPPAVESPEAELSPSFTVTTPEQVPADIEEPMTIADALAEPESPAVDEAREPEAMGEDGLTAEDQAARDELLSALATGDAAESQEAPSQPTFYHEVKSNEYLWNIAEAMRPQDISVEQMMLALQRENPHAFYGSTVSHLKQGVVLRIDDPAVLTDISTEEAIAEIARQHQDWLAYRKAQQAKNAVAVESTDVELESSGDGTQAPESTVASTPKEQRLELVTPVDEVNEEKSAQTNIALEAAEERLNELNVELTMANEAVEASKRENKDLLNRLASLEEQMSAMQSLIQLKDAELQRMQAKVADSTGAPAEELPRVTLDVEGEQAEEKPIVTPQDSHGGIEDTVRRLMEDPVTIATIIFIGLFVALIAWVVTRKSSIEIEEDDAQRTKSIDELFPEDVNNEAKTMITERVDEGKESDTAGVEPLTELAFGDTEFANPNQEVRDPITEADVYLSYNKTSEAEELLNEAIEKEPNRQELKLKLLEVFAKKNDLDAFDNQAEIIYAALEGNTDSPIWFKAREFANTIGSQSPLFVDDGMDDTGFETQLTQGQSKEAKVTAAESAKSYWKPDTVTEISETQEVTQPETELEIPKSSVTEFGAVEEDSDREAEPEKKKIASEIQESEKNRIEEKKTVDIEPQLTESQEPSEKKPNKSSEEAPAEDLSHQDHAVAEMLSELQTANPDKVFDEDQALDEESSMFLLSDEIGTKLDLAKAYIEMGDQDGAKDLLKEVMDEGDSRQKDAARELLEST